MVGGIIVGALLALWVSSVSELSAQPLANVSAAPITVLVCDRAGVSGTDRIEAREVADRILKRAHIQMAWFDNRDCVGPQVESYLSIVIVPQRPKGITSSAGAMGRATLIESPYPRAYIFLDRVRRFDVMNRSVNARSNLGSSSRPRNHARAWPPPRAASCIGGYHARRMGTRGMESGCFRHASVFPYWGEIRGADALSIRVDLVIECRVETIMFLPGKSAQVEPHPLYPHITPSRWTSHSLRFLSWPVSQRCGRPGYP